MQPGTPVAGRRGSASAPGGKRADDAGLGGVSDDGFAEPEDTPASGVERGRGLMITGHVRLSVGFQ